MDDQVLFSQTVALLEKGLDVRSRKHNLTISNVANLNTPNYKAFDIVVEDAIKHEMAATRQPLLTRTDPGHVTGRRLGLDADVRRIESNPADPSVDGNTVELDREMTRLAENHLMYNTYAQIISRKFKGLKHVIQGGKS